jgi:hypothetical protein
LQFEQKKKSRTIHASPSDASVDNRSGFKKGAIRKLEVVPFPDQSFSVAPLEDLKAGEYLLILGRTTTVYDFGID